jgi:PAS domain S-box-containing protein
MQVLVVDDHELIRRGLISLLSGHSSYAVCGEAVDGRDAVQKARDLLPDIAIMDVSMPNLNGLDATREIKRLLPQVKVLIVTQHQSQEMLRQAYKAGASGYIVKSSLSTDLLKALDNLGSGNAFAANAFDKGETLDAQEILQRSAAFEQALRDSEERFRAAMNNMAEGLYTTDLNGLVTYMNPAAEAMFGWSSAELLGKKMHDLTHYRHPDGTPFPASECSGLLVLQKGVELREHHDTFIRKNSTFFPVVFSSSPLRMDGKIVGLVVVLREDAEPNQSRHRTDGRHHLSARFLQSQDQEKRRIARVLHDGVGQSLAALNMNLDTLVSEKQTLPERALRCLKDSAMLAQDAVRQLLRLSYVLHPPLLDEAGLRSALQLYADDFIERHKIQINLEIDPEIDRLPQERELAVFRIVEESLNNIAPHSGSPAALVRLLQTPQAIRVEVSDTGHGMSTETKLKFDQGETDGLGLSAIRERVSQFGGELEFSSGSNGTKIIATLPTSGSESVSDSIPEEVASAGPR